MNYLLAVAAAFPTSSPMPNNLQATLEDRSIRSSTRGNHTASRQSSSTDTHCESASAHVAAAHSGGCSCESQQQAQKCRLSRKLSSPPPCQAALGPWLSARFRAVARRGSVRFCTAQAPGDTGGRPVQCRESSYAHLHTTGGAHHTKTVVAYADTQDARCKVAATHV